MLTYGNQDRKWGDSRYKWGQLNAVSKEVKDELIFKTSAKIVFTTPTRLIFSREVEPNG